MFNIPLKPEMRLKQSRLQRYRQKKIRSKYFKKIKENLLQKEMIA